jgi:hypothetical protein
MQRRLTRKSCKVLAGNNGNDLSTHSMREILGLVSLSEAPRPADGKLRTGRSGTNVAMRITAFAGSVPSTEFVTVVTEQCRQTVEKVGCQIKAEVFPGPYAHDRPLSEGAQVRQDPKRSLGHPF